MGDGGKIPHPLGLSNLVSLGGWYSIAVRSDGSLLNILNGQPYAGLDGIAKVSAPCRDHGDIVALKRDGSVVEWSLRANDPPKSVTATNVSEISAGGWQKLALKKDGTVFAFGFSNMLPEGLSNVVAISAGETHSLALRRDGTVVAWGWGIDGSNPNAAPVGLSNVVAIAAGFNFSLAITPNAAVAERFRR
jgi:alpha-tubulin suppressor-like RCC1 family protein